MWVTKSLVMTFNFFSFSAALQFPLVSAAWDQTLSWTWLTLIKVIHLVSRQWCHEGGWKAVKYSLASEQGLQPLNEYDLWVLPTIPWALILPLQKKKETTVFNDSRTLGWAPTAINEPVYREQVSLVTQLPRQSSMTRWIQCVDLFLLEYFSSLIKEHLSKVVTQNSSVKRFSFLHIMLTILGQFKYIGLKVSFCVKTKKL